MIARRSIGTNLRSLRCVRVGPKRGQGRRRQDHNHHHHHHHHQQQQQQQQHYHHYHRQQDRDPRWHSFAKRRDHHDSCTAFVSWHRCYHNGLASPGRSAPLKRTNASALSGRTDPRRTTARSSSSSSSDNTVRNTRWERNPPAAAGEAGTDRKGEAGTDRKGAAARNASPQIPRAAPAGTVPVGAALEREIAEGRIRSDAVQAGAAGRLDRLFGDLFAGGTPGPASAAVRRLLSVCGNRIGGNRDENTSGWAALGVPAWDDRHRTFAMSRRHPKHRAVASRRAAASARTTATTTMEHRGTAHKILAGALGGLAGSARSVARGVLRWISRRCLGPPVRGVYLHGPVGVGKSFLMDLFHDRVVDRGGEPSGAGCDDTGGGTTKIASRRVHFHEFMLDVHQRLHSAKKEDPSVDALPEVARGIAEESRLLCFDEFQVTDIADAMVLKRLFEELLDRGVVVVATSNRPPSRLYEGGLNRARFLPFVDTLCDHCEVVEMRSNHDYRKDRDRSGPIGETATDGGSSLSSAAGPTYFWPIEDPGTQSALASILGDTRGTREVLPVRMGRTIAAEATSTRYGDCGRFSFDDLCGGPLGASDYLALAERFGVLVVEGVPVLDASQYNEARRFVTLVDACYESRVRMVLTASVPLGELFVEFDAGVETSDGDEETALGGEPFEEELAVVGEGGSSSSAATTTVRAGGTAGGVGVDVDVEWSATGRIGVSLAQLSSVREVVFSFRRAESRLHELCGVRPGAAAEPGGPRR